MSSTILQNKNKFVAVVVTIAVHALLFLMCYGIVFVTPLPPFEIPKPPPEIEISWDGFIGRGQTDAGGSGEGEPDIATAPIVASSNNPTKNSAAPKIIVDNTDESVSIENGTETNSSEEVKEPEVRKVSSHLAKMLALAKIKSEKKTKGKGTGIGKTGGDGDGTSTGVGGANGTGHGNGPPGGNGGGEYFLRGRSIVKKAKPLSDSQEEGIVVVEIIVNQYGKVIKATAGQKGSTTTNANLYAKARMAALAVKFNPSPNGEREQKGTYTFVFILE
jgi:hypothetical protein